MSTRIEITLYASNLVDGNGRLKLTAETLPDNSKVYNVYIRLGALDLANRECASMEEADNLCKQVEELFYKFEEV